MNDFIEIDRLFQDHLTRHPELKLTEQQITEGEVCVEQGIIRMAQSNSKLEELATEVGCTADELLRYAKDLDGIQENVQELT
jgi:hypothetical protein